MSKQCLEISQMQHLKELGVDTRTASLCWVCLNSEPYMSFYNKDYPQKDTKVVPAFTLQDILDLLPKDVKTDDSVVESRFFLFVDFQYEQVSYSVDIAYEGMFDYKVFKIGECQSLIDAAYGMLCWVIENGYLEVK